MSSQRALADFDEPEPAPGQDTHRPTAWTPQATGRCVYGAGVDAEAARVMGVDGVVPACPACWECPDGVREYRTVAKAVAHFQRCHGQRAVALDAPVAHPEVEP